MAENKENQKPAKADKAAKSQSPKKGDKRDPKAAAPAGGKAPRSAAEKDYVPRIKKLYQEQVVPKLKQEFGITNQMAVPRLEKVVLNMGMGEAIQNIKILDDAVIELATIAGQQPVVTRAKKSIAAFKLREGVPIGCRVTLRGNHMWDFIDRLISIALPRVRDFRGVSTKSFDGRGNYTLGVRDHLIFPEIDLNKIDKPKGLNITFVTTAGRDDHALVLLRELGMPFVRG